MRRTMNKLFAATAVAAVIGIATPVGAAEAPEVPSHDWSFSGMFGTYDRGALRRGLQVYREVCASCHSLNLVAYRNLGDVGFGPDEIQAIAEEYEVEDGPDDEGEMFFRTAKASDRFVAPFPNDQAARASNNGALPPDLSLMVKARPGGADYLYALLTGFEDEAPEGVELMDGMYYNNVFPGHQIAMAPVLYEDGIDYADGTEATMEQQAEDVTTFLAWAAMPELEERKGMGVKVLLFLIVLTAMLFALKRKIWSDVH